MKEPLVPNYWVVGATVSLQDMSDDFITRGFWFGDREDVQETINQISAGDRLAIKSMLGQGANQVSIKAVGLVTHSRSFNATPFRFFYVDWLDLRLEDRKVPFHGFGSTIRRVDGASDIARLIFSL